MHYLIHLFMLFFICSIIGFLCETITFSFREKRLVKRGFLLGPYLPIYGFGSLLIYLIDSLFKNYIVKIIFIVLSFSVLEYFTSFLMEKFFNARWWDYSNKKFNINGRICLYNMFKFTILGILTLFIIKYFLMLIYSIPDIICLVLLLLFILDLTISLLIIFTTNLKLNKKDKDDTNKIHKIVKDSLFK